MSRLVFQNEEGMLRIGGGAEDEWRMTEIAGLDFSPKSFQTAVFAGQAGQRTLSEQREPRVITLAGDICPRQTPMEICLSQAMRILDRPGVLSVRSGAKNRRICARCTAFDLGDRHGKYRSFRLQFCCDSPYFEESNRSSIAVFERVNNLKNTFTLPCPVSSRLSRGCVINRGDAEAEPIFEIYFGLGRDSAEEGFLELWNHRTGKRLKLLYAAAEDERVTVDIPNRKIYNQKGENLISALSADSFLSDFILQRGANDIEVINHAARGIAVVCRFFNKYLEAAF